MNQESERLFSSIRDGHVDYALRLVTHNPTLVFERDLEGRTCLIESIRHDQQAVFDHLTSLFSEARDWLFTTPDNSGAYPFEHAVRQDTAYYVQQLAAKGADINVQNQRTGNTAMHILSRHYTLGMSEEWHDRMLETLKERGINHDLRNKRGETHKDIPARFTGNLQDYTEYVIPWGATEP